MEFIKTKKGWLNLENEQLFPFGDISINMCNNIETGLSDVYRNIKEYYKFEGQVHPQYIIGLHDSLKNEIETKIFSSNSEIIAIMIFWDNFFSSHPTNALPYKDNAGFDKFYLPIFKYDAKKMFDIPSQAYTDLLSYNSQRKIINLITCIANNELDGTMLNQEEDTQLLLYSIDSWLSTFNEVKIPTIMRRYKDQYYVTYLVDNIGFLYGRDILELINFKYSLTYCPICNKMFAKKDKRVNFCPKCSADKKAQKQYNDRKRKKNPIQIEHKAIVDMLRNRGEDYNDFVTESYYYRDLIDGKEVSSCPVGYDSSIQTKRQYEEWLKKKHKELTKRPKKRPVH